MKSNISGADSSGRFAVGVGNARQLASFVSSTHRRMVIITFVNEKHLILQGLTLKLDKKALGVKQRTTSCVVHNTTSDSV